MQDAGMPRLGGKCRDVEMQGWNFFRPGDHGTPPIRQHASHTSSGAMAAVNGAGTDGARVRAPRFVSRAGARRTCRRATSHTRPWCPWVSTSAHGRPKQPPTAAARRLRRSGLQACTRWAQNRASPSRSPAGHSARRRRSPRAAPARVPGPTHVVELQEQPPPQGARHERLPHERAPCVRARALASRAAAKRARAQPARLRALGRP